MPRIETPDGALVYVEHGTGVPVVLLHATASNGGQWASLARRLAPHYRVVIPDLPGYGGSSRLVSGACPGLTCHALAVRDLIDHLGEPVHLVGHSVGAAIALHLAVNESQALRSLTLIEPTAFHLLRAGTRAERGLFREVQLLSSAMCADVMADDPHTAVARFVDFWNGQGTWSVVRPGARIRLAQWVGQIIDDFAALYAENWPLELCAEIACPTFAVLGTQSRPHSQRVTEMIAETVPGAQLHMVLGADHQLPVSHDKIVNGLVAGFLAEAGVPAPVVAAARGAEGARISAGLAATAAFDAAAGTFDNAAAPV